MCGKQVLGGPPPPPPWKLYFITLPTNSSCSHWSSLLAFYWCFHCTKCGWNACVLFRVVVMCCWMSLSENLWPYDVVLSSGNSQGQIWWCGEWFYFVSAVLARKLPYSKHVMRRNYSFENIGGVACHWLLQRGGTAKSERTCGIGGGEQTNNLGTNLKGHIDFWYLWHQEEQGKKCFEQCKWELSVLLCQKTMFKVKGTISMKVN